MISRNIAVCIVIVADIVLCFANGTAAAPPGPMTGPGAYIPLIALDTPAAVSTFPPVTAPDPVVRWIVDQVEPAAVHQYESILSGEQPVIVGGKQYHIETRYAYSQEPISVTTRYAGDHLAGLGLAVEYHVWGPATAPNVIGQKTGTTRPDDIFMVTAHLDDMPTGPTAPGADDNASGSTAVLIAADILSQFSWDCTVRFALFTGEEDGLLGSDAYAKRAKSQGENIAAVFNLDMIGWNTPGSPRDIDLHAKSSMPLTMDLANQAASIVAAYDLDLIPEVRGEGLEVSDHASFWDYGYTAIMGTEDFFPNYYDFDPYYHTTDDTLSTLDLDYLTEYVKLTVAETAHMAGCLTTGTLQGQVAADHDHSPIANAEIKAKDAVGREYVLQGGTDGSYRQGLPPATYSMTASTYGYESNTVTGAVVPANNSALQDFVLTAAIPTAPEISFELDAGGIEFSWPHVSPNVAYEVHESDAPYFAPDADTRLATVSAAHRPGADEVLTYPTTEDGPVNRYYIVLGINAAGVNAASAGTGRFNFDLFPPESSRSTRGAGT